MEMIIEIEMWMCERIIIFKLGVIGPYVSFVRDLNTGPTPIYSHLHSSAPTALMTAVLIGA